MFENQTFAHNFKGFFSYINNVKYTIFFLTSECMQQQLYRLACKVTLMLDTVV